MDNAISWFILNYSVEDINKNEIGTRYEHWTQELNKLFNKKQNMFIGYSGVKGHIRVVHPFFTRPSR